MIDRSNVVENSSNVVAWGYDVTDWKLAVEFKNGSVYEYRNVPPQVIDGLLGAESKGSYLRKTVIGHFEVEKLQKAEETAPAP